MMLAPTNYSFLKDAAIVKESVSGTQPQIEQYVGYIEARSVTLM
jgi:hypothetical protein